MSSKAISACVNRGFEKYEDDPEFQAKSKKEKLGFLFGVCRANAKAKSDFIESFIDDFVLIDDYPVKEHERGGVKVKAHTRGEKLKELEKRMGVEKLKKLKIHYGMGVSGEIGKYEKKGQEQFFEIDVWIEQGFKEEFENKLWEQDIKDVEFEKIDEDEIGGIRYAVKFRAFSKINIPEGKNWQVKNVFKDDALPGIDAKQPSAIKDIQSLISSIQSPYGLQDETTGSQMSGVLTFTNRPMTPVTSSNVKGVGVFQNDLLVQFWGTQGTYRYHFDSPQEAYEASQHMTSGSPGRYVWNHLRGKQIGPAYFSGKPTPGGTNASIVPYDIAGRTPMPKVPDYDKIAKMLHEYKMAVKKPPESGEAFTVEEILAKKRLDIFTEVQKMFTVLGVKGDFVVDDSITLKGPITRGGMFLYPNGWEEKDYWQLKELYQQFGFLPAYSQHDENELVGFGTDWIFEDPNELNPDGYINAEAVIFDDVIKKYRLKKKDLVDIPVSVRQKDDSADYETRQNITDLFHIAIDLKGEMLDRCSLKGGRPCRMSIVSDGIKIAKGSILKRKGVASGLVDKLKKKLGSDGTGSAIKNYIKEDKLMPNKKDKKDENIKDDQSEGANVHVGADTTGFGYVGDRDQFMSACRQSGGSEASCAETWDKKVATGTGAEGVPKQGPPDVHKYDFAELDSKMKELDAKLKKVDDFIEVQEKVKADAEAKEATEIREFLTKKYGKEKCDFVDDLDLKGLRAAKMSAMFMETKLKKDFDMNDKSDGFEGNVLTVIDDFEGYIDTKMEGLKVSKFGWGVTQEVGVKS